MKDNISMQSLSKQIGAAHDMMQQILEDPSGKIPGILWGALSGVEIVLQQAREADDAHITSEAKQGGGIMSLTTQIADECSDINERISTRHTQCRAILSVISADPMFKDGAEHKDVWYSIWAVVDLLDLAGDDLKTLEGELLLLYPGAIQKAVSDLKEKTT